MLNAKGAYFLASPDSAFWFFGRCGFPDGCQGRGGGYGNIGGLANWPFSVNTRMCRDVGRAVV